MYHKYVAMNENNINHYILKSARVNRWSADTLNIVFKNNHYYL